MSLKYIQNELIKIQNDLNDRTKNHTSYDLEFIYERKKELEDKLPNAENEALRRMRVAECVAIKEAKRNKMLRCDNCKMFKKRKDGMKLGKGAGCGWYCGMCKNI